jgi:hypothetical protein
VSGPEVGGEGRLSPASWPGATMSDVSEMPAIAVLGGIPD